MRFCLYMQGNESLVYCFPMHQRWPGPSGDVENLGLCPRFLAFPSGTGEVDVLENNVSALN